MRIEKHLIRRLRRHLPLKGKARATASTQGEGKGCDGFAGSSELGNGNMRIRDGANAPLKKSQRRSGVTTAALLLCNITNSYNKRQVN
jgi:hypothetical protein